jgi:hypothetical protein
MSFLAHIANAQVNQVVTKIEPNSPAGVIIGKIMSNIVIPLFEGLFIFALLIFIWGVVDLIRNADSEDGRRKGEQHILWGVIGIFIMISAYAIVRVIANTVGVSQLPF